MFDYQTSKHAHFNAACRAFALAHNLEDVAAAVGCLMRRQSHSGATHITKTIPQHKKEIVRTAWRWLRLSVTK